MGLQKGVIWCRFLKKLITILGYPVVLEDIYYCYAIRGVFSNTLLMFPISFIDIISSSNFWVVYFRAMIGTWGVSKVSSILIFLNLYPLCHGSRHLRQYACSIVFYVDMRACSCLSSAKFPWATIFLPFPLSRSIRFLSSSFLAGSTHVFMRFSMRGRSMNLVPATISFI